MKRQSQLKAEASTNLPAAAPRSPFVSSPSPSPLPNAMPSRAGHFLHTKFSRHTSTTMELPAYTFCHPPEQPRRKSQTLTFSEEGFPVVRPLGQSKVLPVNDTQENYDNSGACYACVKQSTGPTPAWLKFDRQVLRFYAFFKEQVDERVEENARYRKCTIYFYLADGMIHIGEPAQRNSGIYFQGVFLKKQKVPNGRGGFLAPADFQLGKDITIYSHTFHIVGCDVFTKRYLMKQRLPVGDEEPWPNEPLEEYRAHYRAIIKPHHKEYALRQFLDLDGKVLRFFCIWDDRAVPYGERRPYVLHYFLGDDTIEILELNERNSGRMHFPMLIRRKKLEKETPHDLLSQKKICGEKDFGPKDIYYRDTDLHIGSYIRVFDRDLLLHDVDEFTRNYYRTKYGYSEDMLAAIDVQEDGPEFARMEIPEHNGIGSEADSLMNCIMLIPKAPQKDFIKFIYKDGKILTFSCRMVEDDGHKLHPVDKTRMMIFQYYLADDTIQVFEPPARNSGCVSGKYIQRVPVPRIPGMQRPYHASDCFMDQKMYLFDRIFELMEADEWTLKHMEDNPKMFPLANYEWVANKIRAAIKKLPVDKSTEFSKSIRGPDPPPSPPPKNPCSPMPPASPCGNKCAEMATPPLSPKRPCSPPDPRSQSPPSWPPSPSKSQRSASAYKPMSIKELLGKYGINVTKQEVVTLERYVGRNKDKFANVYDLLKSYF